MHDGEVETDAALVRRLLAAQFPQWADLDVTPVESHGTDNAIYRLGSDLAVRMPRIDWAVADVHKEHDWLPRIAPHLSVEVAVPVAKGAPGEGYPWPWTICPWIDGDVPTQDGRVDKHQLANDLADFVLALERIDTSGAPPATRGVPLIERDGATRRAIASLGGDIDESAVSSAWEAALAVSPYQGPPVWVHGDLKPDNLLVRDGRLTSVIDFGGLGVGDPACDTIFAWNFLDSETRPTFRAALGVDDATWARGRGWALSVGLIALPYYRDTNPVLATASVRTIAEVLSDLGG